MLFSERSPRVLLLALAVPMLGGCGVFSGVLGHDPQEQQYAKAQSLPPLEVPPDLAGVGGSSALVVPGVDDGSAPAAAGEQAGGAAPPAELLAGDGAAAKPVGPRIEHGADGAPRLVVPLDFGRAWRTVGKAIEAAEMNVDDRDRLRGLYFVDYRHSKPRGRLARTLMFWAGNETTAKDRFLVLLQSEGDHTNVLVFDEKEKLVTAPVAEDILRKIQQNLD